jgi:hypothetical protein
MTTTAGEPVRPATATGPRRATADTPYPEVALLSNGSYGVLITAAGAGVGTWRDLDVTRWREDATRDCWGQFGYVRDLGDGTVWSVGHQPLCRTADEYDFAFHADRAEFRRRDGAVETRLAVRVAPDHDAEVRLVTLINHGDRPREFDLTSYAEVCLNHRRADQAHPAFAKLFWRPSLSQVRCPAGLPQASSRRRKACLGPPRHRDDGPAGMQWNRTDRVRFLGRAARPPTPPPRISGHACQHHRPGAGPGIQSAAAGPPRAGTRPASFVSAADTREAAIALAEHFQAFEAAERSPAFGTAVGELQELGLTPEDVALFNRLAGAVVFTGPALRVPDAVAANRQGQPGLWPHAISGDRPIVLARVVTAGDESLVRQLVQWHVYARRRGLDLDLVLLGARPGDAAKQLKAELRPPCRPVTRQPGGFSCWTRRRFGRRCVLTAAAPVLDGGGRSWPISSTPR